MLNNVKTETKQQTAQVPRIITKSTTDSLNSNGKSLKSFAVNAQGECSVCAYAKQTICATALCHVTESEFQWVCNNIGWGAFSQISVQLGCWFLVSPGLCSLPRRRVDSYCNLWLGEKKKRQWPDTHGTDKGQCVCVENKSRCLHVYKNVIMFFQKCAKRTQLINFTLYLGIV